MKFTTIPNTEIKVSKICLGTMTFGEQNTEAEAHEQLDFALDHQVNFIDTAELYAVPTRPETQGLTETYIGNWIAQKKNRDQIVLATKIAGPSRDLNYIRPNLGYTKDAITEAIHKSLKRLKTDYIDLYQLHWPDRNANFFGKLGYQKNKNSSWEDTIHETIKTLDDLLKEGKIRHYGLSNETPWGVMRHLQESKQHQLTRAKTVQNPYSLLNRTYEIGLAEISIRENIGLLPYSPMAFGLLSGKFLNGKRPKNARITLYPQMSRYNNPQVAGIVEKYAVLAQEYSISLAQMSLAFINQQDFVTSTIIGATSLAQLDENIKSIDVVLSDEILKKINAIHQLQPNPAP
ncbi:MAG TPA: NADP(H)-dependent aldo-keto reductase [Lutibacter sp.]|nr:NADP(H)-dependent aldo-keto reductase [Lutibacter sp.]